ncbi:hypothetical protein ACUW97_000807 [Kocuria rhizophila]
MTKQPRTLRDVALAAKARHDGAGGRGLAKVATKHGHTISYGTIDSMLAGTYTRKPSVKTLRALAYLADLPEHLVLEIAGMRAPSSALAEQLPEGVDELGPEERQMLIDMARGLIRQARREQKLVVALRDATERLSHEPEPQDQEQEPRAEAGGAQSTQPSPMNRAGESPAAEGTAPPVPDEYALAAYDAPSEGRAMRTVQDQEAEASQDGGEWDPA